jgi:hypothetical protein
VHGETSDGEVATRYCEKDRRVVGPLEHSASTRCPSDPVKEGTGDEHRLDTNEIAEHPADLGPRLRASEQ